MISQRFAGTTLLSGAMCLLAGTLLVYAAQVVAANMALYHDAVWDFGPAVGLIRGDSLTSSQEVRIFGHPVPIMSSPYSGAYKIWALAPLIKILGTSPRTIVTLNALFGLLYLLALYWALRPLVGPGWAAAAFVVPFVDTNLLLTVPVDVGITLTQYIFISLSFGAFARYLRDPQPKHYRMIWFLGGCILAQKLTALPVVAGIMIATVAVSFRQFVAIVRAQGIPRAVGAWIGLPAALVAIPVLPDIYYFYRNGFADLFSSTAAAWEPFTKATAFNFKFFISMFDGWDWYSRIIADTGPELAQKPILAVFGLSAMACFLALCAVSSRKRRDAADGLILTCAVAIGFLLYPAFRGLNRPWHLYVLAPGFYCCAIVSLRHLANWAGEKGGFAVAVRVGLSLVGVGCLLMSSAHSRTLIKEIEKRKGECIASPIFYEMYGRMRASHVDFVYAVNYSLGYPVYVLSEGTIQVDDLAWTPLTPEKTGEMLRRIKGDPDAVIAYRQCQCKDLDPQWVHWLNRDAELPAFIKSIESDPGLSVTRFRDARETELVVVRRAGGAAPLLTGPGGR